MLEERVRHFAAEHSLFDAADRLLVAFSGGPDSACLLTVLHALQPGTAAAYVNHHLRGAESDREEAFVTQFCADRNIPLFVEHIRWRRTPANLEEAARRRRYRHLTRVALEHHFTKIALAHQQEDVAETVLLRLLRGAGPRGLAGPALRRGIFIRPLLEVSRREILQYLEKRSIPYFTDTSNTDLRFLRNRIRHELLPHLARNYNRRVREALFRTAFWVREQNELVDELVKPLEERIHRGPGTAWIGKDALASISTALQKELLRRTLLAADPTAKLSAPHWQRLLRAAAGQEVLELPGFLMVESQTDKILFSRKPGASGYHEVDVPGAGTYFFPPAGAALVFSCVQGSSIPGDPDVACLDAEKAGFPLHIRNWKKGDRFRPLGMNGTRKLSDFWIDQKVPRAMRNRIPLVFKDDDLIWIAGHRLSHDFRVTENTRLVLRIELKKSHV